MYVHTRAHVDLFDLLAVEKEMFIVHIASPLDPLASESRPSLYTENHSRLPSPLPRGEERSLLEFSLQYDSPHSIKILQKSFSLCVWRLCLPLHSCEMLLVSRLMFLAGGESGNLFFAGSRTTGGGRWERYLSPKTATHSDIVYKYYAENMGKKKYPLLSINVKFFLKCA